MSTYRSVAILAQAGFKNNTFLRLFGVVFVGDLGPSHFVVVMFFGACWSAHFATEHPHNLSDQMNCMNM